MLIGVWIWTRILLCVVAVIIIGIAFTNIIWYPQHSFDLDEVIEVIGNHIKCMACVGIIVIFIFLIKCLHKPSYLTIDLFM
jgi:hypothetical protein